MPFLAKANFPSAKNFATILGGSEVPGGQNLARILPRFLNQNVVHVAM